MSFVVSKLGAKATSIQPAGYFTTLPPGSPLPSDAECATLVRQNPWEPRPQNNTANQTNVYAQGYRLTGSILEKYSGNYESRVTGNFTGTTDEIIQWAACKWGFDEDTVRAQAVKESYWDQGALGDCGLNTRAATHGCASVGLLQDKAADIPPTHPGTWPYAYTSTAFNVDYTLAVRRACFEGYETWLRDFNQSYAAGDIWGCIGRWYSGRWYDSGAQLYIKSVQDIFNTKLWIAWGYTGPTSNTIPVPNTPTPQPTRTPQLTPTPPPIVAPASSWRVEAGNTSNYTDSQGNVWLPDQGITGGSLVDRGNIAIANTSDPQIYQTEHYGMTSASYPVPNGTYMVKLHFAETFSGITGPGQRVFTVTLNGNTVLSNFDVYAQAGGADTALLETFLVTATNGQITITFTPSRENPEINGIEIVSQSATSPLRIDAGSSTNYTGAHGSVWLADQGFTGGLNVDRGNISIANTSNPQLYQTEHYGMTDASYAVPNGTYTVKLHFAETFTGITGPGQRVFNVNVDGIQIDELDVYAQAGGADRALIKSVLVTVTDGQVKITFTPLKENPEINAIEILTYKG
jgi:autotransporter family porin